MHQEPEICASIKGPSFEPFHELIEGTAHAIGMRRGTRVTRTRVPLRTENAPRWSATSCSPTDSLRSTIGARGLNFRVRNGTGCASPAMVADQRGAFCCQGGGFRRALGAAQRGFSTTSRSKGPHATEQISERRARPISTARLRRSHALHLRPIDLVVYQGPYRRENSSWDWLPA